VSWRFGNNHMVNGGKANSLEWSMMTKKQLHSGKLFPPGGKDLSFINRVMQQPL
jgi:hypothetical protein